eukprot:IDg6808t1
MMVQTALPCLAEMNTWRYSRATNHGLRLYILKQCRSWVRRETELGRLMCYWDAVKGFGVLYFGAGRIHSLPFYFFESVRRMKMRFVVVGGFEACEVSKNPLSKRDIENQPDMMRSMASIESTIPGWSAGAVAAFMDIKAASSSEYSAKAVEIFDGGCATRSAS